ncbi:hypothetical protein V6N13_001738 [Hibiscus sabdariffa]
MSEWCGRRDYDEAHVAHSEKELEDVVDLDKQVELQDCVSSKVHKVARAGSRKGRNSVAEHCPTAPAVVGEGQDLRMLAGGNIKPSLAEWMSLVPDKVGQGVVLNGSSILQHASEREVATSVLLETEQQVVGIRCQLCMIQLSLAVQRLIALCRCSECPFYYIL